MPSGSNFPPASLHSQFYETRVKPSVELSCNPKMHTVINCDANTKLEINAQFEYLFEEKMISQMI